MVIDGLVAEERDRRPAASVARVTRQPVLRDGPVKDICVSVRGPRVVNPQAYLAGPVRPEEIRDFKFDRYYGLAVPERIGGLNAVGDRDAGVDRGAPEPQQAVLLFNRKHRAEPAPPVVVVPGRAEVVEAGRVAGVAELFVLLVKHAVRLLSVHLGPVRVVAVHADAR